MIKENLEMYTGEPMMQENEVATVVAHLESTIIFKDDQDEIFLLSADTPETFEIGTVANKNSLQPLSEANSQLKETIIKLMEGGY